VILQFSEATSLPVMLLSFFVLDNARVMCAYAAGCESTSQLGKKHTEIWTGLLLTLLCCSMAVP
jgi:hypothetical protein